MSAALLFPRRNSIMLRAGVWSLKTEAHTLSPRTFCANLNFPICIFVLDFSRGFIRNVSRGIQHFTDAFRTEILLFSL
jgi:hypothetical protein